MAGSPKKLELVPYALANLTKQVTGGNPLLKHAAPDGSLGIDMKYALTPGLTFTGTINPDFGQVEADPAVVNLTAFETFFSERRPFFVEGSGNFNFPMDCNDGACTGLFYSRRIGRAPQGLDDLPSDEGVYTDAPPQTTILGAGKLTGRVGNYSIGVMQAFTQEETARVLTGLVPSRVAVEPATSYTVGRVRREFANQSSIGAMVTSTDPQPRQRAHLSCRPRVHRRSRLGRAIPEALLDHRLLGRQQRARLSRSDRSNPGKQPPLLSAARSGSGGTRRHAHVARRRRRHRSRSARSAASGFASIPLCRSRALGSTSTTSASCGAPISGP